MDFQVGQHYFFVEVHRFARSPIWERLFTVLDFSDCLLLFYLTESRSRLLKTVNVRGCEFFDAVKVKNRPCTMKIAPASLDGSGRLPDPFYVTAYDIRSLDAFKLELEQCGGSFGGLDRGAQRGMVCCASSHSTPFSQHEHRISRIPLLAWTVTDVQEWLRLTNLDKESENTPSISDIFSSNEIDGTILSELDLEGFRSLGLTSDIQLSELMEKVNQVKETGFFAASRWIVASKFSRFSGFSMEQHDDLVECLCDEARIKHRFLNSVNLATHANFIRYHSNTVLSDAVVKRLEIYEDAMMEEMASIANVKIKLVVTEILQSDRSMALRSLISPLVNALVPALSYEFGMFHTALIIGPWYLEWTDSELIIPKHMVSGRAIISADVESLEVPENCFEALTDKIAEVVVKWNTRYKYRSTPSTSSKNLDSNSTQLQEGNCQDFVDDMLRTLGVSIDFEGALGDFVTQMRKSGKCILEFSPSIQFQEFFEIPEKRIIFKTHRDLDLFCSEIRFFCLDWYMQFSSAFSLLKSFDRAYWLRHLKNMEDERYKPLESEDEEDVSDFATGCPFDDPRKTKSYFC